MYQGGNQQFASPVEALAHISETPWSNWTKADYTLEQWHKACLIHIHDGEPTSKSQCKLPVKTPDGSLNRNGVHAAAAALAGARGGLKGVSAEQKNKAAAALRRYYSQLEEDVPESLAVHSTIDFRVKPGAPSDILEHHGVKGMRWGVRNEDKPTGRDSGGRMVVPPKTAAGKVQGQKQSEQKQPVLSERKQRKIEQFEKRSDIMGTKISELKVKSEALKGTRNPSKLFDKRAIDADIKNLEKAQNRALRDAEAVQKGKLTSKQKKVIVGAVAVSAIGAYVVYTRGQQSGAFNSYALRGSAFLRGQKVPFDVNPDLAKPMKASDLLNKVAKPVNPGYASAGGKMNCRRSTYAYELRRRGFDVHATTSAVGWGQSESGVINAVTPGSRNFYRSMSMSRAVVNTGGSTVARGDRRTNPIAKILLDGLGEGETGNYLSSSKRVLEELGKQPNGARGEVLFKFPQFGHSMAYEIVDGKPHIFDSQKGTLYNAAKRVETKWDGFDGAEITRLDNVDLDLNFLSRWATNVGGK